MPIASWSTARMSKAAIARNARSRAGPTLSDPEDVTLVDFDELLPDVERVLEIVGGDAGVEVHVHLQPHLIVDQRQPHIAPASIEGVCRFQRQGGRTRRLREELYRIAERAAFALVELDHIVGAGNPSGDDRVAARVGPKFDPVARSLHEAR